MIRVLHCVVGMNLGGLETFTMNIYRALDRSKVQFDFLVSLPGVYDAEIREMGGRIYYIPFIDKTGPLRYKANLKNFFRSHPEYSVIHVQMDKFGGIVLKEAKNYGIPKRIAHSHSTHNAGNVLVQLVKNYYGRYVVCNATNYLACSPAAAKWMYGAADNRAIIVRNGIDLAAFTPADCRVAGQLTLGLAARFDEVKNHVFLIDVFSELHKIYPNSQLLLAGEGTLKEQTQHQAELLGLNNAVKFLGLQQDIPGFLSRLDAVCMPSLYEGIPLALIEAQAAGLPCIVSDKVDPFVNIGGDVSFIPLENKTQWVQEILKQQGRPRKDNSSALETAGYSVRQAAALLQELYIAK